MLRAARLQDLVDLGSLTPRAAAFLEASVRAGLNILVAGGTQAGNPNNCCRSRWPGTSVPVHRSLTHAKGDLPVRCPN
jgi:pilus assembly protein CpaF